MVQLITISSDNECVFYFSDKDQEHSVVQKPKEVLFVLSGIEGFLAVLLMGYTK